MTADQITLFAILVALFGLLAWGRWRYDVVAFLTPIGHQNNALIMGPGGYRFWDYWRMGLPLEILIVAVATPMILWVWPL